MHQKDRATWENFCACACNGGYGGGTWCGRKGVADLVLFTCPPSYGCLGEDGFSYEVMESNTDMCHSMRPQQQQDTHLFTAVPCIRACMATHAGCRLSLTVAVVDASAPLASSALLDDEARHTAASNRNVRPVSGEKRLQKEDAEHAAGECRDRCMDIRVSVSCLSRSGRTPPHGQGKRWEYVGR